MKRILVRASKSPTDIFSPKGQRVPKLAATRAQFASPGTKNAGNLVFAHSVYKAISTADAELSIDGYQLSLNDGYGDQADEINERFDAFVIPMCNAFRLPYGKTLSRMTRTIKRLRIPCIVTGVGAQLDLNGGFDQLDPIKPQVSAFVAAILDRSASIGVRGEITRDYLLRLGFADSQIDVIGCPSMFYNGDEMAIDKKDVLDRIAINLTPMDRPELRHFTSYVDDNRENVTFIPQTAGSVGAVVRSMKAAPNAQIDSPVPNIMREGRTKFFFDVPPWIDFLRTQSFSIGTRIHGNLVALLGRTPAHVIVHDSRTWELASYFEVPNTNVTDLAGFDVAKTFAASDYTNLVKNHGNRVATYARFLERNGLGHTLFDKARRAKYDADLRAAYAGLKKLVQPAVTAVMALFVLTTESLGNDLLATIQ